MPNGGSDCCGTCWFNRSNGGKRGSINFNHTIPSFCEIRDLAISDPFYTYCANHPHHRPNRDAIPIGSVYVGDADGVRTFWQPSPDTEEIRQHLLDIVRSPKEHTDGYPFFSSSPLEKAIRQLVDFDDPRVVDALEDLAQRNEVKEVRSDILDLIKTVRQELDQSVGSMSGTNGQGRGSTMSENSRMDEADAVTTAEAAGTMGNEQQSITFGELTEVDIRKAWPHEAHDFTPWLAENLERLSEVIGIHLEAETIEAQVGEFRGDILATGPEGQSVLIENQLEWSDHTHLGQIMTYLAGLNAQVVVWIARDFAEPHVSAIQWLNRHTENEFAFFALKLRVVRIANSPLVPIFEVIAKPNNWERQVRDERTGSRTENVKRYREFWTHYARRYPGDGIKANHGLANAWVRPRNEAPAISLAFSYASGYAGIFFTTQRDFSRDALKEWRGKHRQIINDKLGGGENWKSFDTHNRENWDAICDWLHEKLGQRLAIIEEAGQTSRMKASSPSASAS